jgi:hypothetical protein
MPHLQTEFQRLYLPPAATSGQLIDDQGLTRALVLEVGGPADWDLLGAVWRGVQAELEWPAPGIAASGTDGLQLWFSLAEPVTLVAGRDLLDALSRRYLPELPARRLRLWPTADGRHAPVVPALMDEATGNWSAFVAPDLAPLFAETPSLDIPPGDEAQALRLAGLKSIQPQALNAARAQLQALLQPPPAPAAPPPTAVPPSPVVHRLDTTRSAGYTDPRAFLLAVMNDNSAPLALRIEAAKGLLAHAP